MVDSEQLYKDGVALLPVWGAPPDADALARGTAMILRAAEQGHPAAMDRIAQLSKDPETRFRFLVKLAELGNGSPLTTFVADPFLPEPIARRIAEAVAANDGWAMTAVAAVYFGGLATKDGTIAVPRVDDAAAFGVAMLTRAADAGYAPARHALATRIAKKERARALDLAKSALASGVIREPGNARHLAELTARLLEDVGGSPNEVLAVRRALVDAGDAGSMVWLGERLRAGDGLPRDVARARELFERAIAAQHAGGYRELAKMLEAGDGVEKDDARAKELYESAVEIEGDEYARERLVTKYGLDWYAKPSKKKKKKAKKAK